MTLEPALIFVRAIRLANNRGIIWMALWISLLATMAINGGIPYLISPTPHGIIHEVATTILGIISGAAFMATWVVGICDPHIRSGWELEQEIWKQVEEDRRKSDEVGD